MEVWVWIWLGLFALFVVIEAMTYGLVSIWFAIGSLAAMFAAWIGAPVWLQILICVAVGVATVAAFRPLAQNKLAVKEEKTGIDRLENAIAVVLEDTYSMGGAVKADGKEWRARTNGETITAGKQCRVIGREGSKLIVTNI